MADGGLKLKELLVRAGEAEPVLAQRTLNRDFFGDEKSTFFDDMREFFAMQTEAVAKLAEKYRKHFDWGGPQRL